MSRSRLCLLLAVVLLASVASLLVVSAVMDPITGIPADLRGKVAFDEKGGISIHGGVGGAQWQEIQELFLKPHASVNPWARWAVNRTDTYSTARFVFHDGQVKASSPTGPEIDWLAPVRAVAQRLVSLGGDLFGLVANALRAVTSQVLGLFTMNASASCAGQGGGPGNTCYWVGGSGNWNDTTPYHWAAGTGGSPVNVLPNATSNITIDTNSCIAACTLTLTPAYTTTGALSLGSSFMTLSMGGNSLSFTSASGTCGLSAGGVTNTSGTFTCGGVVTLNGGYYDGSAVASGGISWASLSMTLSSYLKFGSSTADLISGNVAISDPSYIVFSSGTLTVGGSWTNSTASSSWVVSTSTVLLNSASSVTFTPANFTNPEFYNVHFQSTAARIFSLATRSLRWSGILTVDGTTGAGTTLDAYNTGAGVGIAGGTAGSVVIGNLGTLVLASTSNSWNSLTINGGSSGILTLTTGTIAVSGSWDTSGTGSTFTKGTSTITMSGTAQTVKTLNATNGFYNLTVSGTITESSAIDVSNALSVSGSLTTSNNNITGNSSVTVTATGTLVAGSSSITVLSIDTSAVGATFTVGTSTVIMGATGGTIKVPQPLANLTVNAAVTTTLAAGLTVGGTTTVNGVLTASTFNLTLSGTLAALSGGITAGASGAESIAGNVSINATGYFSFGGASWSFLGAWTNASTSALWAAGTGTVTFTSPTSATMTFAALPGAAPEFSNVQFSPPVAATFTMATNALVWSGTLTLNNNATLATGAANLGLTGGNLTVGNGATLASNGSAVSVANVTMTGTTSGTITLTTGSWTVSGNWDTSGAGSVFTRGTSTVTLSGAGKTVKILSLAYEFNALTITGTITLASAIGTSSLLTVTGTLDTSPASNFGLTAAAGLTVNGATGILKTNASAVSVTGNVNVNNAAGYITATGGSWTVTNGTWADLSTSASWSLVAPVTFISNASGTMSWGPMAGNEFGATVTFDSSVAGGVTFTSAANVLKVAGALTIQNSAGGATANTILSTGANPYFNITAGSIALGTRGSLTANSSTLSIGGNFTTTGANAAWTPGTSTLTFTANATITLGAGQMVNTLIVNGGTLTFGSAVTASGAVTVAASMTTSATNFGFTAQNTFTINGNGSFTAGASTVAISGAVSIAAATAYITSASGGTWTVSGAWTNASTSASWSFAAPITFSSAASVTITFAGTGITEFANVTFSSSSTVAFTMAGNALKWSGTLTLQGSGANTTTLNTSGSQNNGLTGGSLVIGNSGILTANNSTVSVLSVNMTGGASGSLSVGAGAWTIAGTWNTSGTGSTWTTGIASTYTLSSTGTIATLPAQNTFPALTVSGGTVTLASNIVVTNALTVSSGLFAKATFTLSTGGLVLAGGALSSTSGAVTINGAVNISSASSYIQFGSEAWTVTGAWSNSSTSASWNKGAATVTFNSANNVSMTFAGTNLSVDEFSTVVFSSSANAARTFTLATRGLRATTIQVNDTTTTTALDTAAGSNFPLTAGTLTIGAGGILQGQGSTITVTSMDTSVGAFTPATSTVFVGSSGGIISVPQTVANLTVSAGVSTTFSSALTFSGALTLNSSTPTFTSDLTSSGTVATLSFASAAISIAGNWNSSSIASMTATSSTVTFAGTSKTVTLSIGESFANVTISGTISQLSQLTATGILTVSAGSLTTSNNSLSAQGLTISGGFLAAGISTVLVNGNVSVSASTAYITTGAGTWTVSGSWTNSSMSASWSFAAGMTFSASVSQTMTFGNLVREFAGNITFQPVSGTPTFTMSTNPLKWGGALTVAGCTLFTSATNLGLNGGALVVGTAGVLTASASGVSVSSVTMTGGTSGTITLTSGTWTVSGSWDTSGAGSTFTKGTSTVTMSGSGVTVKILNASNGFASLAVTGTVTMSSAIDVSTALVVSGTLTTSGNGISGGGNLAVQGGGTLTASTSSLAVGNVSMTDASVDTLSFTSGTMTVSGNWDTSGASAVLTQGTSSISLSGPTRTVKMSSTQSFATLTVSGTVTQQSKLTATSVMVSGTLTKTSYAMVFNALTCTAGSIIDGTVTVTNFTVADNDPAALITVTVFSTWTVNAHYNWTHSDSKTTDTITFTIGGNTNGNSYVVTAGGTELTSGTVVGGNLTFSMSGSSSIIMDVLVQNCGGNRYWVGGTGNWSDPTHWASMSGGTSGCGVPTSGVGAVFDANSGAGTTTVNLDAAMGSLTTMGSTITTIAIGTFNFAVSGTVTLAGVALTLGVSAGTGLTATGSLTLSGTASIDGSAGASIISVSGDTSISSATAYIKFGSGSYTFSGAWSNASTSASWATGTGTVIFNASASRSMTFAALPGATAEFYTVQFTPTAAATFTMGSNGLVWSNVLTLNGSATLATSGLALTGGSLVVGNGGTLAASSSTVSVVNVTMTGGTSGSITLTSGTWSVSGNWDTSGSGSTFTGGTATVTMNGASATTKLGTGQGFYALSSTGASVTAASFLLASALTIGSGTLNLAGFPLFVNGNLSITGTGSLNFSGGSATVLGNVVDTSSNANTGPGTLALAGASTQSVQGGIWPNVQVVGGEKDFTANLTTLNVTLLGNASVTIRVTAGITWTLTPGGVVSGSSSTARLVLTSSGTWTMGVSGVTGIAQWVQVDHSTATTPGGMQAFNSVDGGANTNWTFPSGGAPLGPFLLLLQKDPIVQLGVSSLGFLGALLVRRYHRKRVTCPVCGHRFTAECKEHDT